ncbi:hypothetical protein [Neobacillus sp. LXY-4]|uniref:hypothetical protein n=1 Tax=Neobacillus sp. LXY-4 TaxID=3379826 RepID=UPI003EDE9807
MTKRMISIFFMIFSFTILSACESEQDIDKLIQNYVKEKYGFTADITNREGKNEGNMGDRTYTVQKSSKPQIKFQVHLTGMLKSKIEGDNYHDQKKAYELSQKFFKFNQPKLEMLNFEDVYFTASTGGLVVNAVSSKEISFNQPGSIDHLLEFVLIANTFKNEHLPSTSSIESIKIFNKTTKLTFALNEINTITNKDALLKELNNDPDFVNDSLFKRDFTAFQLMEKELEKIGYRFTNGLTIGMVKESIYCYGKNITNGECTGGYEVKLDGPKDPKNLFALVQILKNNQEIKIKDIVIPGSPLIMIENIESITSAQQIKLMLDK